MGLPTWQVRKARRYSGIRQRALCVCWCLFASGTTTMVLRLSLSCINSPPKNSEGKKQEWFEVDIMILGKILKGFTWSPRSFRAFFWSLSSHWRAVTGPLASFDRQEERCAGGASLLPCLRTGEALRSRQLSSAFPGPKLAAKPWAGVPAPCEGVAFRSDLGFACAFFRFRCITTLFLNI